MSAVVLLTGATGFLGTQVARRLIQKADCTVIALVRAEDREAARHRLARAWWDWRELADAIGTRVQVECGDVSAPCLGLEAPTYDALLHTVTHIVHSAADLRVNAPIQELRRTNVQGTANLLDFARAVQRGHGLARFSHVSTAYVCGGRRGAVPEEALSEEFGFSCAYEFSKYEGERLVQAAKGELPISVLRPGMIVGDSRTGEIKTFNSFYFPLKLYLARVTNILPANPNLRVNIVPVDYVADAIVRLTFDARAEGLNFHLTAPYEALPTARELAEFTREWAKERLHLNLPKPIFIPLPEFATRGRYNPARPSRHDRGGLLGSILTLAPYFNERVRFQRANVDRLLGSYEFKWREMMPPLLDYATFKGFMHRSDRTVHEQIVYRLRSTHRGVTYYDIVQGQIIRHSAAEVRRDMLAAANALRALGIKRGDRVALVGLNSTRYLILDVAIGLVGAVSVPLYYTSPPADLDAILQASGARLLFIGAPQLLERLAELKTELPMISFLERPVSENRVMGWAKFLSLGRDDPASTASPAGFGDLATLRYSSGTTGRPKGVMFYHEHLRWMGECLPALMPWTARNKHANYLSWLPMNHVVEGITAAYSPYYTPAPVNIYYLQDLRDLARTLPRVKPTVFFSVPRAYEKMWERFQDNRLARLYLGLPENIVKRTLRPLLRASLLRNAGLDRSVELMVGSAPCSEDLLRAYHELGVEVHNSYGLTEAPLVTLCRQGANRIGTVGELLPETQIRIEEDGELLVRGPQVTAGYFDAGEATPFRDGWLATGDLGQMTEDGSLVILGRKKELIKTAYAKYVQPGKVESRLKEIPGVAEAMLVGEGKPFCVALLWVDDGHGDTARADAQRIDRAVLAMNEQLSHPEQVKRWAILPNDLSIERGDLTANLKLKRQTVARRLQSVVSALYDGGAACENVLHLGAAER
ncbi:MAG: long-chain fatty acid--CoA ligase [Betaproteobacteria bacterium SG8_41]|nr:MAG: long-chain fatty acid--CoA ligase [Betaproteobacteria bacterium SG8_41]